MAREMQRGRAFYGARRLPEAPQAPQGALEAGMAAGQPGIAQQAGGAGALGGIAGVGMGAVFGGPVGLAMGGLVGVLGYMDQQRQAKQAAAWQDTINDKSEKAQHALAAVVNDENATPGEREAATERFRLESEFLQNLTSMGPAKGAEMLAQVSIKDRERQQQIDAEALTKQRDATLQHRGVLRSQANELFDQQSALREQMEHAHALLDDPTADIDHPFTQAQLMRQLEQAKKNMLTNAEDMTDAMRGIGGTGLIGGVAALASLFFGTEKAEEMRFSREEWRTLLQINETVANREHQRQREKLYREAATHVEVSDKLGLMPDEFVSLLGNFAGREAELDAPVIAGERGAYGTGIEGPKIRPSERLQGGRPTNGSGPGGEETRGEWLRRRARELRGRG